MPSGTAGEIIEYYERRMEETKMVLYVITQVSLLEIVKCNNVELGTNLFIH